MTVQVVFDGYMAKHGDGLRTGAQIRRRIEREVIPRWADRSIESITEDDVIALLDEIRERPAPILANRMRAHLQGLFGYARAKRLVPENIMRDVPKPAKERHRQRTLNNSELRAVWQAAADYPFGLLVRLLILLGQRRGEVAEMRWEEVDAALWTIPPHKYKSDKPHLVPLPRQAVELLRSIPAHSAYVFSTRADRPVSGLSKAKARLDAASGVTGWVLHDLRRTVRTELARMRVSFEVAELVIGHTLKGLHAVYDQHAYLDERREALQAWADCLEKVVID